MTDKDNFQKEVVQKLQNSGFKELLQQTQHKQFIQMIAATFYSNEIDFKGMIQYLTDIVEQQNKRKEIAQVIKNLYNAQKAQKAQKKVQQQPKEKQENLNKQPQKKVKTQAPVKGKQTKNQKPKQQKKQNNIEGDQQNNQQSLGGQKKNLKHELQVSGKTKCRFFPFCKNPQSCEFYHPTQKCQYFPNCRYADNCLYIHEPCRFKEKCTKMNCPYAHPGKRTGNNMMQAFMKSMMMGKNPIFGNNKIKKRKPTQSEAKEEEPQQQ